MRKEKIVKILEEFSNNKPDNIVMKYLEEDDEVTQLSCDLKGYVFNIFYSVPKNSFDIMVNSICLGNINENFTIKSSSVSINRCLMYVFLPYKLTTKVKNVIEIHDIEAFIIKEG